MSVYFERRLAVRCHVDGEVFDQVVHISATEGSGVRITQEGVSTTLDWQEALALGRAIVEAAGVAEPSANVGRKGCET